MSTLNTLLICMALAALCALAAWIGVRLHAWVHVQGPGSKSVQAQVEALAEAATLRHDLAATRTALEAAERANDVEHAAFVKAVGELEERTRERDQAHHELRVAAQEVQAGYEYINTLQAERDAIAATLDDVQGDLTEAKSRLLTTQTVLNMMMAQRDEQTRCDELTAARLDLALDRLGRRDLDTLRAFAREHPWEEGRLRAETRDCQKPCQK